MRKILEIFSPVIAASAVAGIVGILLGGIGFLIYAFSLMKEQNEHAYIWGFVGISLLFVFWLIWKKMQKGSDARMIELMASSSTTQPKDKASQDAPDKIDVGNLMGDIAKLGEFQGNLHFELIERGEDYDLLDDTVSKIATEYRVWFITMLQGIYSYDKNAALDIYKDFLDECKNKDPNEYVKKMKTVTDIKFKE